jgi:hypothetical protein
MTNTKEELSDNKPLIEVLSDYDGKNVSKTEPITISEPPAKEDCANKKMSHSGMERTPKEKPAAINVRTSECDQSGNIGQATALFNQSEHEQSKVGDGTTLLNQSEDLLHKTLEELKDPEIPVKGHALIALRRLVERKDTDALQNQEMILKIFLQYLGHSDSYIYLAAIQGLTSIAMINTDRVINVLIEEYVQCQRSQGNVTELRMKIGEVLVKTSKQLGRLT